jgi:tRNA(Ile)-lysidine synthase
MLSLAERVSRTIQRQALFPPGARVLAAVSGGADSTALACLLTELAVGQAFEVVGAAHFNHRMRGAAADADQAFCEALAARLGLTWRTGAADVPAVAAAEGRSLEEAARGLRYAYLGRTAVELGATHVAVGHTRDDQAETVLLQMFRGAGPRGLRAMAPGRLLEPAEGDGAAASPAIRLVRPLLEVGHQDLVAWLSARSVPFREDDSNRDARFLRNRIRLEVLPFLEREVSKGISRVLARDAAIAAADAECLDSLAAAACGRLARATPGGVLVSRGGLLAEPDAIAWRVVLRAVGNLSGTRFVGLDQAERMLALVRGRLEGPLALPGAEAVLFGDDLLIRPAAGRSKAGRRAGGMNFLPAVLSIPGETPLPGTGWVISSSLRSGAFPEELKDLAPTAREAVVDAARATGLVVRWRRPGDWFRPLGLDGRKKLQDYFMDRKVPRDERDRVPLVVDERDRIVWVAGHGIDEEYRVRAGTRDVVILKLRGESF